MREVKILCYAGTTIFAPDYVDPTHSVRPSFSLAIENLLNAGTYVEVVMLAPGTAAAEDATKKVCNTNFTDDLSMVFYNGYAGLQAMLTEDTGFRRAYNSRPKLFNYYLTNDMLPYSIFEVKYRSGYQDLDHVKIDFYSLYPVAESMRRSMVIWKSDDPSNYDFFCNNYEAIKNMRVKNEEEQKMKLEWLDKWKTYKADRDI